MPHRIVVAALVALFVLSPASAQASGLIALLPLNTGQAHMDEPTRLALEDEIRTVAGEVVVDVGLSVAARDTTLALLADNNVDATKVCEGNCSLSAAREMKAKYFIAGTVTTSEGEYVASLRLIETRMGEQLGSLVFEGTTIRDMRRAFAAKVDQFFKRLKQVERGQGAPSAAFAVSWTSVGVAVAGVVVGAIFAVQGKNLVGGDTISTIDGVPTHSVTEATAQKANAAYVTADIAWGVAAALAIGGGVGLAVTWPKSAAGSGGDVAITPMGLRGSF